MKKIFYLLLMALLPLLAAAQTDTAGRQPQVLDPIFHGIAKCAKNSAKKIHIDTAQQSKYLQQKITVGLEFSFLATGGEYFLREWYLLPSLTFSYKRNYFSLGPKFYKTDTYEVDFRHPELQFVYQVNPFKEHRFLNFYFQYSWAFNKNKYNFTTHETNGSVIIEIPASRAWTKIDNIIGYGIRFNFYKGLYLYQSLGLGIAWTKNFYRYDSDHFYSGANTQIELTKLFMAGLGYRFGLKAKKKSTS
jgi:hypothetical protein